MINTIKVFLVVILLFGLMIPLSLYLQTSRNEKILDFYQDGKIRETCPDSPDKISFQSCFRKDLAKALSAYTPNDALKILSAVREVKRLDLLHGDEIKETSIAQLEYFENWILIIESSNNLGVNRNDTSFFDIILVPYVKYQFKKEFQKTLQNYMALTDNEKSPSKGELIKQRWNRVDSKFSQLKID